MKKTITFLAAGFLLMLSLSAQKNSREVIISTQIYCTHCDACETCKSHVENTLYKLKGVKLCEMKSAEQKIRVIFNPKKTNETEIKTAISRCGYNANEIAATEDGLKLLDNCCRKKEE